MIRTTLAAAVVLLATPLLASCSSDDEPSPAPSSGASSEATSGATTGAEPSQGAAAAPRLDRPRPALKALKIKSCTSGTGEVSASGTIRNSDKKPVDFVITVEWYDEQSATVATEYAVLEDVPARKSKKWDVSVDLGDTTSSSCSTRAASGRLLEG